MIGTATTDASGGLSLRLEGLRADAMLYLVVSGEPDAYQFTARANTPAIEPPIALACAVSAARPQTFRGLELSQSGLLHIEFAARPAGAAETSVEAVLFDAQGNVVFRRVVVAGQTAPANLFLPAGRYTWRFVAGTADGSPLGDTSFTMRGTVLSDPIGPPLIDPTQVPPTAPPLWMPEGFLSILALIDPYGRPLSPLPPLPPLGGA